MVAAEDFLTVTTAVTTAIAPLRPRRARGDLVWRVHDVPAVPDTPSSCFLYCLATLVIASVYICVKVGTIIFL